MDRCKFEVRVPTKPMSGSRGKRRHERKEELIKAIKEAKPDELETARRAFRDKRKRGGPFRLVPRRHWPKPDT